MVPVRAAECPGYFSRPYGRAITVRTDGLQGAVKTESSFDNPDLSTSAWAEHRGSSGLCPSTGKAQGWCKFLHNRHSTRGWEGHWSDEPHCECARYDSSDSVKPRVCICEDVHAYLCPFLQQTFSVTFQKLLLSQRNFSQLLGTLDKQASCVAANMCTSECCV